MGNDHSHTHVLATCPVAVEKNYAACCRICDPGFHAIAWWNAGIRRHAEVTRCPRQSKQTGTW